jgi:hypothetical protein
VHTFETMRETAEFLRTEIRERDLVLLKGRFSSHICRLVIAQVTEFACWVSECEKRFLCDRCTEMGASPESLARYGPRTQFDEAFVQLADFRATDSPNTGADVSVA